MGHTRLGTLPKTRKWDDVVAIMAAGDGSEMDGAPHRSDFGHEVARIAEKAMDAAAAAFDRARDDPGLTESFWLLIRISLACRSPDPVLALEEIGLRVGAVPARADIVREVTRALDEQLFARGRRSDFAELGGAAVAEALSAWLRSKDAQGQLFANSGDRIWSDLRGLATQQGFGEVTHGALGTLTTKLLGFYLSRAVSPGEDLIGGVADLARFEKELRQHSHERARIAREFAGTWFTKHEFRKGGITRANTRRFVSYLLSKVASELSAKPGRR